MLNEDIASVDLTHTRHPRIVRASAAHQPRISRASAAHQPRIILRGCDDESPRASAAPSLAVSDVKLNLLKPKNLHFSSSFLVPSSPFASLARQFLDSSPDLFVGA
jgi:hypothetical protein